VASSKHSLSGQKLDKFSYFFKMKKSMVSLRRLQQRAAAELAQTNNSTTNTTNQSMDLQTSDPQFLNIDDVYSTENVSYEEQSDSSDTDFFQDKDDFIFDFKQSLKLWSLEHNIPINALSSLLLLLKQTGKHTDLPVDGRTLLATPKSLNSNVIKCGSGEMIYFGIQKSLTKVCKELSFSSLVSLQFNVDGLPLFKSASSQLWPILCSILGAKHRPFTVSLYYGDKKPEDINCYLRPFVDEINLLQTTGIQVDNRTLNVKVHSFVCDSPARALILGVKSHSGYNSCTKCLVEGDYVSRRVVFTSCTNLLRTDFSFRNKTDDDHHIKDTILTEIQDLDMIKGFPLDFMHLVCLGVVKKMIKLWTDGPPGPFKLPSTKLIELSEKLLSLKMYVPLEFARKPRSIADCDRWKATEFRQFLLYTGPVTLSSILDKVYYDHFLSLAVSISILSAPSLASRFKTYAGQLLKYFVAQFEVLYGTQFCSHNVHCLIHLADEVTDNLTINEISAFKYESELGRLKRTVRSPRNPLIQLANRIIESENLLTARKQYPVFSKLQFCSTHHSSSNHYQKCVAEQFIIDTSRFSDSFFKISEKYVQILCVEVDPENSEKYSLFGREIVHLEPLFFNPCSSDNIGYLKFKPNYHAPKNYPLESVSAKCFVLKKDDMFVIVPLRHL